MMMYEPLGPIGGFCILSRLDKPVKEAPDIGLAKIAPIYACVCACACACVLAPFLCIRRPFEWFIHNQWSPSLRTMTMRQTVKP